MTGFMGDVHSQYKKKVGLFKVAYAQGTEEGSSGPFTFFFWYSGIGFVRFVRFASAEATIGFV